VKDDEKEGWMLGEGGVLTIIKIFIDLLMHMDQHLDLIIRTYGIWTYAILFSIIFCETGLVVTPFLPGDSLLFAAGTFAAMGSLDILQLAVFLSVAAIMGDTVNYWIGHATGPKVFTKGESRFLNKRHLERTNHFYKRYGGKTIILARFVPIIRTFAPFVAGIGCMDYTRFLTFNVIGGLAWIAFFILGGYFFGNIPFIKHHFTLVILTIIIISILPGVIEFLRQRYRYSQGKERQGIGAEITKPG
jgi:membrane-associated protein